MEKENKDSYFFFALPFISPVPADFFSFHFFFVALRGSFSLVPPIPPLSGYIFPHLFTFHTFFCFPPSLTPSPLSFFLLQLVFLLQIFVRLFFFFLSSHLSFFFCVHTAVSLYFVKDADDADDVYGQYKRI